MRAVRRATLLHEPRIVVTDCSTVAREGIAAIVRGLPYELCGLTSDQQTTNDLLQQYQSDLLLIEPFLGNRDGISFVKELKTRFPGTRASFTR